MNQISQDIILVHKTCRVILEGCYIHRDMIPRKHLNDSFLQPIKIHIDQRNNRFIRGRSRPVTLEIPLQHQIHNGIRIVNMLIAKLISIVPVSNRLEAPSVLHTQVFHFLLRKPHIRGKRTGTQHRILLKIVQCRLRSLLFNWKDPGQISKLKIFCRLCSLEQSTKKSNIFFLCPLIGGFITNQNIPFIDDHNEFYPCLCMKKGKSLRQRLRSCFC